ncbi:MAG: OmpA family protein [Candidatus Zixiibacteriota bacterium]
MVLKRFASLFTIITLCSLLLVSCAGERKRTKTGAGIGAVAGAGIGAVIGHQSGHAAGGAAIGAVTGALIGGGIGYHLDKQAEELRRVQALEVKQERDRLIATMPNALLFDFDSAVIKPGAVQSLTEVAGVLNRYPETKITVKGYTDSTGKEVYNQELSERRANSVRNFFIAKAVDALRITAIGFGEQFPIASNDTEEGRQQNRRVELEIVPTEAAARQG